MYRLSKSIISNIELKNVKSVLKREYLGLGPEVAKFESKLKKYFGRDVVCVNSGTAALHLALQACEIGKGDDVLVPCVTYVATYQAITATGAKPVLCDVNPKNMTICLKDLKKKFTKKCKVVIPVHFSGHPCDLSKIYEFAGSKNLKVIEDSAHAFGSIYKGKKIGSQGYINCFSFDGIKNITTGEGGCVVTNDKTIINKIKNSRSLGVINESELRYKNKKKWKINVKSQGWRYHMSDINAAIGNAQLKRFKFLAKKRQSIAKLYDKIFLKKNHLLKIFNRDYNKEVPHIYCVVLNNSTDRDKLREKLLKNNIQTGIHYIPGYLLDYYKKNKRLFPNCEKVHKKVLTLPLHPDISPKNINFITKKILNYLEK